jgi:hypothetical protein
LIAFDAAFMKLAQSDPSRMVRITDSVRRDCGSGLCTEPKAQTAPETIPSSGGSSVNGRASWL